jgi:hypothetical protein
VLLLLNPKSKKTMIDTKTLDALKLALAAIQDIVRQLPVDEKLADYNLDLLERAEATAKEVISGTVPYDERTERQRVIDELINDVDLNTGNGSMILSYLKRNRTKQVD